MKEMDSLATRLRSWQPRRPSPKLKRRLFATPAAHLPKLAWVLGSLAPATACALLTFSVFNAENNGALLRREPMTAMILSNQDYAAYASDNFRETQNGLSAVTFEWTNRSNLPSSIPPFSPDKSN